MGNGSIRLLFVIASLLATIAVTLGGIVGFVGLIVPHIVRQILSSGHRLLVPVSAVVGGLVLLLCDTIGRSVIPPYEIPVGVITGFFGGLFFLYIIKNSRFV